MKIILTTEIALIDGQSHKKINYMREFSPKFDYWGMVDVEQLDCKAFNYLNSIKDYLDEINS